MHSHLDTDLWAPFLAVCKYTYFLTYQNFLELMACLSITAAQCHSG